MPTHFEGFLGRSFLIPFAFLEARMTRAYSAELRGRVIRAASDGLSARAAAARFGVGVSTAIVWVRRFRQGGEAVARRQGKPRGSRLDAHKGVILGLIKAKDDIALVEMARLQGRARRGERCRSSVPHGHWKTTTFTAGLRLSGFTAPMVLDGPMRGEVLRAWTEQVLAPTLSPGDVVILDHLPAHRVAGVREAIQARGARLLFLPPYSPDFNPIENAFAKLKAVLRKAATRTMDELWTAIGQSLTAFSPAECANYFSATGYEPE
jgi:transposase